MHIKLMISLVDVNTKFNIMCTQFSCLMYVVLRVVGFQVCTPWFMRRLLPAIPLASQDATRF
jgi:hypothetical protein